MPTPTFPRPIFPLREAHGHLLSLAHALNVESLHACASIGECLEHVKAAASRAPASGGWVRLQGARINGWTEGRWPTLDELDAAAGDVPAVVFSFDHHHACANSAALNAAGLTAGQHVGSRGLVQHDETTGRPTGVLVEDAAYAVWNAAPPPTREVERQWLATAIQHLHAMGFVEVHDLHSPATLGPMLAELDASGRLPMRVRLYAPIAGAREAAERRRTYETPRVTLAGAKVFLDGTLNGRSAMMIHRYNEPMPSIPRGQCNLPMSELDADVRLCEELGLQLAVHAIGDCAVRSVLDSVVRVKPGRNRVRIEHAEIVDRADVPRFAALGVTCSVQPCHLLSDVEALRRFVPHRLDRVLPLKDLLASGLRAGRCPSPGEADAGLVFGSDVPIVRADPEDSIQAAVNRRRFGAPPDDAIAPEQAISEREAWMCFACDGE